MQQERPGAPLPFEACENFRELGGYTGCGGRHVKYGAFYRSPALANIKTPADRARFEELGVRTVFDFRSEKERTLAPDPDFPGVVNIPASAMLAEDGSEVDFDLEKLLRSEDGIRMLTEGVHESYARMPFGNPAYRALFGAIRAGQTPILFHCTAGKDRTGVAAALILADKMDVRANRVRPKARAAFDIHDRVNYSVKKHEVTLTDTEICLTLAIDTEVCAVIEYFEIFMDRMLLCRRAAEKLGLHFALVINGQRMA